MLYVICNLHSFARGNTYLGFTFTKCQNGHPQQKYIGVIWHLLIFPTCQGDSHPELSLLGEVTFSCLLPSWEAVPKCNLWWLKWFSYQMTIKYGTNLVGTVQSFHLQTIILCYQPRFSGIVFKTNVVLLVHIWPAKSKEKKPYTQNSEIKIQSIDIVFFGILSLMHENKSPICSCRSPQINSCIHGKLLDFGKTMLISKCNPEPDLKVSQELRLLEVNLNILGKMHCILKWDGQWESVTNLEDARDHPNLTNNISLSPNRPWNHRHWHWCLYCLLHSHQRKRIFLFI